MGEEVKKRKEGRKEDKVKVEENSDRKENRKQMKKKKPVQEH